MAAESGIIRAAVFDLDDTLYPESQYVLSGYLAIGRELNARTGSDKPFAEWMWSRFLAGKAGAAIEAVNRQFNLNLSEPQVTELINVYRNHAPRIRPYDGMIELLGRLHETLRLGLLSDGFLPAQQLKLDALKIERFFDAVVFTESLGREAWKPSDDGFTAVSAKLSVAADACAYVADNPEKDFVAPNRLGWRTVQFIRPGQIHSHKLPPDDGRPRIVVTDIEQLRAALR